MHWACFEAIQQEEGNAECSMFCACFGRISSYSFVGFEDDGGMDIFPWKNHYVEESVSYIGDTDVFCKNWSGIMSNGCSFKIQ